MESCAAAKKIFLIDQYKLKNLQFANDVLNHKDDFWSSAIFSNEKTCQFCNNGRLRVYTYHETGDMRKITPSYRTVMNVVQ